jgi:tetratricopeptide (TPR) repeat protein
MNVQKDFFVSYNKADRQWAEWIAWTLEESEYSVVIQAWDFRPGGNFVLEMQRATVEAQKTIAVLSEDYLKSAFTQPEWAAAFAQDPQGQKGTLIPVRVQPCKLSGLLAPIIYVDLLNLEAEAAQETLLKALEARAKPFQKPQFPGSVDRVISTPAVFPGQSRIPQNLPRSGVVEFVGRDPKLQELHTQLQQNESSAPRVRLAITAIAGMGGIGKTELALQYAIAHKGEYSAGLCWLRVRDQEIATQIVTFAQAHLGLTPPDQLEIKDQVRFCWQQWPDGDALVVLDNVTDYKAIEPYLPPSDPRFKLIITTRMQLGSSVKDFPVEELDEDSAIALLASLVKNGRIQAQADDAKALCKWVGYLPLALELLGRFLARKPDWSIARLLNALDVNRLEAKALIAPESGMTAKLGVAAALELSWQELNESEQELACVLGMFAIAPIPWSLVEQCLPEINPEDLENSRDEGLISQNLLKRIEQNTYQLHQVIQEFFRIKLNKKTENSPSIKNIFCRSIIDISKKIDPDKDQAYGYRGIIAHLEETANIWIKFNDEDTHILLFNSIVNIHLSQCNYKSAELWAEHCLEYARINLGKKHMDFIVSLNTLGDIYAKVGQRNKAEKIFLDALEISRKSSPKDNSCVAIVMNNLANIYRDQGRYEESEKYFLKTLKIFKKRFKEERHHIAMILHNLAGIYRIRGKYNDSEKLYLRSLNIFKRIFGYENCHIATSLHNLAILHRVQRRHKDAEELTCQALKIRRELLGEEHLETARSLHQLAMLYSVTEKYKEAEPLHIRALEIKRKFLGDEHLEITNSLNDLGYHYHAQGKYWQAESYYLQDLRMSEKLYGTTHPDIIATLFNLGILYKDQRKLTKASRFLDRAVTLAESKHGVNHPTTQYIRQYLDSALYFDVKLVFLSR